MTAFLLMALVTNYMVAGTPATRGEGPAGSVLIVDESHAVPVVHVVVAARTGSAADPRGAAGLMNLAAELARHGAAGRRRQALDEALDALGANLEALVDPDSVRFVGQVLSRNLEPFLALLADIILRPDFDEQELARTRREILAQQNEMRNDDRSLCARFFDRRLYGEHPYGHAPDGTTASLARIGRAQAAAHFHRAFVGKNLVFAAAGDVAPADFRGRLDRAFSRLSPGAAPPATAIARPPVLRGWRIQIVDKPDRQQTQIMFGHAGLPAAHPDFLALRFALSAFGGRAMKATLMDEVRTKRGLAYGAYAGMSAMRGPAPIRGWVFSGADRTVATLKLVLRLYRQFMKSGLTAQRVRFFQAFVAGAHAADMDAPERRLAARIDAEIAGLPPDTVDTFADRVRGFTPDQVNAAIRKHVRADDLAITLVATADSMTKRLVQSGIAPGAIDVVRYDSY